MGGALGAGAGLTIYSLFRPYNDAGTQDAVQPVAMGFIVIMFVFLAVLLGTMYKKNMTGYYRFAIGVTAGLSTGSIMTGAWLIHNAEIVENVPVDPALLAVCLSFAVLAILCWAGNVFCWKAKAPQ